MKKSVLLICLLIPMIGIAQNNDSTFTKTVEIEIDPIAYALKGYSVHAIGVWHKFRTDLGVFGIETPGQLTGNKGFTIRNTGFGVKFNYLIRKVNGFYSGIDIGYAETTAIRDKSEEQDKGHNFSFGAHAGYRYFPFTGKKEMIKGLYLTPWAGISYNHTYDKIKLNGYNVSSLGYFATFHVGYRF